MLKNYVNKLPRKTQSAMQDSATENCSRKNTPIMMRALCNSLTIKYYRSNPQNNWLYAAAATNKPGIERVQALAGISRLGYVVIANETRALIANPPNSAQLGAPPTIPPNLHLGPCSSVGMRRGTVRQTHRRPWPIYIPRRLRLRRNLVIYLNGSQNVGHVFVGCCLCWPHSIIVMLSVTEIAKKTSQQNPFAYR